jgi:hypothetical protein
VTARLYRPAAPLGAPRLGALAVWAALAALLVGALAHVFTELTLYLDLLVPGAIGIAVGTVVAAGVTRLAVARPWLAASVAAVAAVGALAQLIALDFRAARAEEVARIDQLSRVRQDAGLASEEELAAVRSAMLRRFTFSGYAQARIGLDDSGRLTGTPPVLGRAGATALSAIEVLLAALLAAMSAGRAASHPVCPLCGRWRVEHPLGTVAHGLSRVLVSDLLADRPIADRMRPPDTREETRLALLTCPAGHDHQAGVLRIYEVTWTRHRRRALRRVEDLELDATTLAPLRQLFDRGAAG